MRTVAAFVALASLLATPARASLDEPATELETRIAFGTASLSVGAVAGVVLGKSLGIDLRLSGPVGGLLGLVAGVVAMSQVPLQRGSPMMLVSGASLGAVLGATVAGAVPGGLLWVAGGMLVLGAVAPVFEAALALTAGDVAGGSTGLALGLVLGLTIPISATGDQSFGAAASTGLAGGLVGFAAGAFANRALGWGGLRWALVCLGSLLGAMGGIVAGMEVSSTSAIITGWMLGGMVLGGGLGAVLTGGLPRDEERPPAVFPPTARALEVPRERPSDLPLASVSLVAHVF